MVVICEVQAEIIFETDFSEDIGYSLTNTGPFEIDNLPTGWDGAKASQNNRIEVIEDPEIAPKPVLKLSWDPAVTQPTTSLLKHLTGNDQTGYDELYIRYHVRLPDNFKASDGAVINHWKWGRLWQNTPNLQQVLDGDPRGWNENRVDSFYVVWNWNGGVTSTDINAQWGANSGTNLEKGSAGGPGYLVGYFRSSVEPTTQPGYFRSVGGGDWDFYTDGDAPTAEQAGSLRNQDQSWHTIEYRFKLASALGANDGVFEVWIDGVKQDDGGADGIRRYEGANFHSNIDSNEQGWTELWAFVGASVETGIPTIRHGSGFNFFTFFDNMVSWNSQWGEAGVEGGIYVNDLIISTERIGHEYVVGQSSPPGNLSK